MPRSKDAPRSRYCDLCESHIFRSNWARHQLRWHNNMMSPPQLPKMKRQCQLEPKSSNVPVVKTCRPVSRSAQAPDANNDDTISTSSLKYEIRRGVSRIYELAAEGVPFHILDPALKRVSPRLPIEARHATIFTLQASIHHSRMKLASLGINWQNRIDKRRSVQRGLRMNAHSTAVHNVHGCQPTQQPESAQHLIGRGSAHHCPVDHVTLETSDDLAATDAVPHMSKALLAEKFKIRKKTGNSYKLPEVPVLEPPQTTDLSTPPGEPCASASRGRAAVDSTDRCRESSSPARVPEITAELTATGYPLLATTSEGSMSSSSEPVVTDSVKSVSPTPTQMTADESRPNMEGAILPSVCDLALTDLADTELLNNLEQIIDAEWLLGRSDVLSPIVSANAEIPSVCEVETGSTMNRRKSASPTLVSNKASDQVAADGAPSSSADKPSTSTSTRLVPNSSAVKRQQSSSLERFHKILSTQATTPSTQASKSSSHTSANSRCMAADSIDIRRKLTSPIRVPEISASQITTTSASGLGSTRQVGSSSAVRPPRSTVKSKKSRQERPVQHRSNDHRPVVRSVPRRRETVKWHHSAASRDRDDRGRHCERSSAACEDGGWSHERPSCWTAEYRVPPCHGSQYVNKEQYRGALKALSDLHRCSRRANEW